MTRSPDSLRRPKRNRLQIRLRTDYRCVFRRGPTRCYLVTVSASGLAPETIANGVKDAIVTAFKEPRTVGDPFDNGVVTSGPGVSIDVIGLLTTAEGGLLVLLNPLPPEIGAGRKFIAQGKIDALTG